MLSFFLSIRREEKERRQEEDEGETLDFYELAGCITLVAVKGLLRCISCQDRVPKIHLERGE